MVKDNRKSKTTKENKFGLIALLFSTLICLLAVSYAIWTQVYLGNKENSIETATLILNIDESESNAIELINAVPVSDEKGLTNKPYTFKVKNSGTVAANYRVMLVNDTDVYKSHGCSERKLDWSNIKYAFGKNKEATTVGLLSDTSGVLDLGRIEPNQINEYSLILWIKSEATNEIMDKHFHGVIKVDAIQEDKSLDN